MSKSLQKVQIKTNSGEIIEGFAENNGKFRDQVKIIDRRGQEKTFPLERLKAIYFIEDFGSHAAERELSFLEKLPGRDKIWARVEFGNGEILEGKVNNGLDLLHEPGFFLWLWPSDPDRSDQKVFVVKSALRRFAVLAVE